MNVIGFKEARCKNCYKCVRTCQVKAITVKDAQAQIINEQCILCGHCLEACPQNAKTFISDLQKVKGYLRAKIPTIVSLAPAYLGVLPYKKPGQVIQALLRLGFSQVRETAEGAAFVTREYEKLLQEGKMENIITTCCPSVNDLIEIYYPSLTKYMAPVVSPMIAHGKLIREQFGEEVKIVFIGPCIAKKREAETDERTKGVIDAVLRFTEVAQWLEEEGISIADCEEEQPQNPDPMVNRLYPVSSGILSSVLANQIEKQDTYRKFYVHGMQECMELFQSMQSGKIKRSFIEANLCAGGCIEGPGVEKETVSRFQVTLDMHERVEKKAPGSDMFDQRGTSVSLHKDFYDRAPEKKMPSEEEIRAILKQTGKMDPAQELNCGACGYSTCREKAIAVYEGKAELTMCIPFLHEKAQSLSNVVLETTPNIIFIVDEDLKVIEFNQAAEQYFKKSRTEALQMYLYELMDHSDFESVLETHQNITGKRVKDEERGYTTLQNIVYMPEQNSVMGVFQDVSKEEEQNQQAYKVKVETVEMAQKVIDKQMFVAQQIAGLLGETTAQTKVTLTKLRDTILYDGKDAT